MNDTPQPVGRRDWLLNTLIGAVTATAAFIFYPAVRFLWPREVTSSGTMAVVAPYPVGGAEARRRGPLAAAVQLRRQALSGHPHAGRRRQGLQRRLHPRGLHGRVSPDKGDIFCNCHNGVYDLNGRNVSGPPPRPLEDYKVTLRGTTPGQEEIIVSRTPENHAVRPVGWTSLGLELSSASGSGSTRCSNLAAKKRVPIHRTTLFYFLGGMALFLFGVQVVTGILLSLYYKPSPDQAFESVRAIMTEVDFGWLIRSVHSWSANLLIGVLFLHMLTTYMMRAYRRPREFTWMTGVVLLGLFLAFGFSGYLLPWNQLAFFATRVGTAIVGVRAAGRREATAAGPRRRERHRRHAGPLLRPARGHSSADHAWPCSASTCFWCRSTG